jgi:putative transposase
MNIRNQILEPDCYYHIYNRGINSQDIFSNDDNYLYFLKKFHEYLIAVCDVFAYCLMPNHFHFLIRIKDLESLNNFQKSDLYKTHKNGLHSTEQIFSKQMAKFISCYTQSYNKVNNRHGALLESPFKRIKIENEEYLKNLILYIHKNPEEFDKNFKDYKYSSYKAILSESYTHIKKERVIELFGGKENFIFCHFMNKDFKFT